jgi:hypothetical protein
MNFSFPADKQIEFTFRVGIAGTQSPPQMVAVVLERGDTALSFVARQVGDEWKAIIESPGTVFGLGQVKLNVNVILNNRLFTPMKGTAEIVAEDNITVDVTIPSMETDVKLDTPILPPAVEVKTEEVVVPKAVEVKAEEVIIPEAVVKRKYAKLMQADPTVKQIVHAPKVVPKAEAPKPVEKVEPVVPKVEAVIEKAAEPIIKTIAPIIEVPKPVEKAKPEVKKVIEQAKVIPEPIVEKVEITQPVRMQLLKSIEPGTVYKAPKVMESSLIAKKSEQLFTLKRTKIISK